MDIDVTNRWNATKVVGTALLFASAFWILDSGNDWWRSDAEWFSAVVPAGGQFAVRLLYASLFAIAGALVGAAFERARCIKDFAVDKLTDSQHKYRALLASSFDCVVVLGDDATIVELSEAAAALFGNSARAMIGTAIDDYVEVEAGMNPRLGAQLGESLRGNDAAIREIIPVLARGARGRRFPAEVRITKMPRASDSAYLLAIRETTSMVVAQKALRHSERRYQALFDNIPDGVYRSLPDGQLLAANPALFRMLGYDSAEELLASVNARDLFCDREERVALIKKLDEIGEARNVELHLLCRDGSTLQVLANVRAVKNDNNEGVVYEGTLTDITDLVKARELVLDSEEHFRALCENSLDVINVINTKGEITYSSPSSTRLSHRSPDEQLGLKLFRSVHPDDMAEVSRIIAEGFKRPGTPKRFTCRILRDDGEMHYVDSVGTAYLTRNGDLRAVIHSRDVIERMHNLQEPQTI